MEEKKEKKLNFFTAWKRSNVTTKIYQVLVHLFAIAGGCILGAWAIYQLGLTNNSGSVDANNRYLANYKAVANTTDSSLIFARAMQNYMDLAILSKYYPHNARAIFEAAQNTDRIDGVERMLYAASMYLKEDSIGGDYPKMAAEMQAIFDKYEAKKTTKNLIPWLNEPAWESLKVAIVKDKAQIEKAAEMTGVEPRLIVACLVGEQIRLFNSKREKYKSYLGPIKVLSVQSQFSFGINGIKDFTAAHVERNLRDSTSVHYMGKEYEHILDYDTALLNRAGTLENARFIRLTDYHNHLYSYLYTGCILHQTMIQWKRAGYDISDRPDILCTLFNLGFSASKPSPSPQCGGSHIKVLNRVYTFGVIGNDFYFSGELAKEFPMHQNIFQKN
ncbi:MAG: hypothetical protein PHQ33_01065 [Bacteroidales bacterium]|jgi:hypothetical protein|nr:hypothetical protein [Bacteroidales bacterium]